MEQKKLLLPLSIQFFAETMHAKDAISGSEGEAFVTIEGTRYNFAQLINLEARMDKTKTKVPILGKVGKGNKSTGAEYTGSATFHFNTSIFRQVLYRYKETGEDIYFDIQLTNEDPTSKVGRQTVILKDCNLDGGTIALIDADAEYLEESFDFTFEDWEIPEVFKILDVMQ
ncbi:phage tail tube protein [Schinkia azotoformans]|uniref:phage tail tube protein n=1 Tax=Schinkia azotoformans TaxID=1454 RepID=UPI002DB6E3C3|nr:phage tail tube protein [Schinkia azotoformans]MEC1716604.1 phage tail tube protein [Schinkia azotoformans]MEC1739442.1 phage tail tube protein [Schinkia azotoformans]MEC1745488.1 phage tail tube protein [Schinkia azotoformans]MEC1756551.1 phage tail tube protein [Schinkia azotoformans]MEC1765818.1 phage tail tube protein [Schinkia azotoformans]